MCVCIHAILVQHCISYISILTGTRMYSQPSPLALRLGLCVRIIAICSFHTFHDTVAAQKLEEIDRSLVSH